MKPASLIATFFFWAICTLCFYAIIAGFSAFAMMDASYMRLSKWEPSGRGVFLLLSMASLVFWVFFIQGVEKDRERKRISGRVRR